MGDKKNDGKTTLSSEVSKWLAGREGYSVKEAAKETQVSEKEAQEAHEQAAKDDTKTN